MNYSDDRMELFPQDWLAIFKLQTPLFELLVRGSVLYMLIFGLMRLLPRRTGGELATMDLVFVVLVAECATHSMGDYTSISDSAVLISVFVAWNFLVNFLSFKFPHVEKILSASPLQVVKDGKMLLRNMRREFLTKEELMGHLREHGVEDLACVKAAYVESEGHLTVIFENGKIPSDSNVHDESLEAEKR